MNRKLSPFWTLFILTGLNLFNYLDRQVLPAVLPDVQKALQMSDTQAGTANTAFMIGYFLTSPIFGFLGDRWSRKWLIAGGILVWSVGTVLSGRAQTYHELLFYRILVGVGEASYATISPSWISDVFPPAKRNNALTIFYVAIPVGAALGYAIGGSVALRASWRHAFIYAGAPGLLLALTLLPFLEPARGASDAAKAHEPPKLGDLAQLVRNANYLLVVLGYIAYTAAVGGFGHWLPSFFERYHGMNTESAGLFFGATMACAGLVGTMAGGFAATGWQRRNPAGYAWMLTISACLAAPLAAASMLAPGRISAPVWIALALFCVWLPTGPINTLILESVPSNLRASAMAGSIFAIHLFGDMWSPQIVGAVSDRTASLRLGLLLLPGALLVGAALWLALALRTRRGVRAASAQSRDRR